MTGRTTTRIGLFGILQTALLASALSLAGCGGDSPDAESPASVTPPGAVAPPPAPSTPTAHAVGGTVSGLTGKSLVLLLNDDSSVAVSSNGSFSFPARLEAGASYRVAVKTHPETPTQLCTVDAGSGVVSDADIASVKVVCADAFRIGGTLGGLSGNGLILQNNAGDLLTVDANGNFTFPTPLLSGASYSIKVLRPGIPAQRCIVNAGSGVVSGADIGDIAVICTTPTARSAYVSNICSNSIVTFGVDPATGALNNAVSVPAGDFPEYLAIAPGGKFGYVPNYGDGTIHGYAIDAATGALTAFGTPVATNQAAPVTMTFHPAGGIAYVPNLTASTLSVFSIDASSGAFTAIDAPVASPAYPKDIVLDSIGKFAYGLHNNLATPLSAYAIDDATKIPTVIADAVPSALPLATDIAMHPNDKYLYVTNNNQTLTAFAIDRTTGKLTQIGAPVPTGWQPDSLAIDPSGRFAYVANHSSDSISAYRIDQQTGALSSLGPEVATGRNPTGPVFDPSGKYLYIIGFRDGQIWRYAFNAATGQLDTGTLASSGNCPLRLRFGIP